MISFYKKYGRTLFDISLLVITVYLFMFIFSYLYHIAAPIFLALIIFIIIEPFAAFLHRRKMPKMIATAISLVLFISLILGALVGVGVIFTSQIVNLMSKIESYSFLFQIEFKNILNDLIGQMNALPPDVVEKIKEISAKFIENASKIALQFLQGLVGTLSSVSTFVIQFAIGLILAFFLSIEIETWRKIAREKTPKTFKIAFTFLRENVLKGFVSYIKAQFVLISITFALIFISLLILGVNNAFSISLLAAFFDLLPLLGVSTVFIPWIIYLLIVKQVSLALWISGIYLVVLLLRQFLEPKITGQSLGVSAFTMLSFMIISLSIFGVAGLILSPILIVTIKALIEQGYLQLWIRKPDEEFSEEIVKEKETFE